MKTSLAVGFDKIGFMLVLLLVLMVWSGIAPADQTVWMVESVWSTGLLVAPVGGRSAGDGQSELKPQPLTRR